MFLAFFSVVASFPNLSTLTYSYKSIIILLGEHTGYKLFLQGLLLTSVECFGACGSLSDNNMAIYGCIMAQGLHISSKIHTLQRFLTI
jgi:hypothetical protein